MKTDIPKPRLKVPLHWELSDEQLYEIYSVEKECAALLRRETQKSTRRNLYRDVYSDYFTRLPFHPQFKIKSSPQLIKDRVDFQKTMISTFLDPNGVFMEIGAGDCSLSLSLSQDTRLIYAMEVSREIIHGITLPENVNAVIFDGFTFPIETNSVDLAYSNQLMEHLHPEDAIDQLKEILRILNKNGCYICITPNSINGPHDISRFYNNDLVGFHLKEYTRFELVKLFKKIGFKRAFAFIVVKGRRITLPTFLVYLIEKTLILFKAKTRKRLANLPVVNRIINAPVIGVR